MTAAKELVSSSPGPASAQRSERSVVVAAVRPPAPGGLSPTAGNRALARCAGCGGRCGGTCGHAHSEPDEELLASGQQALRGAVLARRQAVSPRS